MMNITNLRNNCFIELKNYSAEEIQCELPDRLFAEGLCVKELNTVKFKFVGLIINKNEIIMVFPKGFIIPEEIETIKSNILLLVNVLTRYSQEKKLSSWEETLLGGTGDSIENIPAAFWLIRDFLNNGIIISQNQEYTYNSGVNINWPKTIKNIDPIVSKQGPIYLDYMTKKNSTDQENLITKIHESVIHKCISLYGWLLDYDLYNEEIEKGLPCSNEVALYSLENELQKTFVDREIELFSYLKEFILGASDYGEEIFSTFITPYFHWIWEEICSFLFADEKEENLIPKPFWEVNGYKSYSEQIPDIIFKNEQKIYILDAKYYNVENAPLKMPGWGDLVKQFFYSHTIKEKFNKNGFLDIENILIFPKENPQILEYLGYAALEQNSSLGIIKGINLAPNKAMEHYAEYNRGDIKEQLICLNKNV